MRSPTELVDKMIGDAYKVVKHVYDHMAEIMAVGTAIRSTSVGAPLLLQRWMSETGATGDPGETLLIPFSNLDIDHSKIIGSHVRIIGNGEDRYFADSGWFTTVVKDDGLWITLAMDAPLDVQNAVVEWFFLYEG